MNIDTLTGLTNLHGRLEAARNLIQLATMDGLCDSTMKANLSDAYDLTVTAQATIYAKIQESLSMEE